MESTARVLVVHVQGTLDASGARALQRRLDAEDGTRIVVADLGAARELQPVALAILARDLRRRVRPRVLLRGLGDHHVRMLRCFGLDVRTGHAAQPALA